MQNNFISITVFLANADNKISFRHCNAVYWQNSSNSQVTQWLLVVSYCTYYTAFNLQKHQFPTLHLTLLDCTRLQCLHPWHQWPLSGLWQTAAETQQHWQSLLVAGLRDPVKVLGNSCFDKLKTHWARMITKLILKGKMKML